MAWAGSPFHVIRESGTDSLDRIADTTHGALKWSHGAFLFMDFSSSNVAPAFYTLDRDGRVISSVSLSIPGAQDFWASDFDRAKDGTIVFVGGSYSAGGQAAPFIAWISPGGRTSRVVGTYPYHPYMVTFAPDGTVWTVGCEMIGHKSDAPELDPNAGVMRHFNTTGKLTGSVIPQSGYVMEHKTNRLFSGFLIATANCVGWYSAREETDSRYVEVSTQSLKPSFYSGVSNLPDRALAIGFALTDSSVPYVCLQDLHSPVRTTYALVRDKSSWVPLSLQEVRGFPYTPWLVGSDGEQLVFHYAHSAAFVSVSH